MKNFICALLFTCLFCSLSAQTHAKETIFIQTPYGLMKLKLFTETPLHRANFLKLVKRQYYDSLMFHRVINNFMIQGGDYLSKRATAADSLGDGDIGYTVSAEFKRPIIHQKGRLAAARDGDEVNPKMASSATQFYIVMGKVRNLEDLKKYEERINNNHYKRCAREYKNSRKGKKLVAKVEQMKQQGKTEAANELNDKLEKAIAKKHLKTPLYKFNEQEIKTYTTVGGTPHLDGTYTVFGEVIEGLEVIDKIAAVKTGWRDRPLQDIRMKVWVEE